jgi:hypothetical protein
MSSNYKGDGPPTGLGWVALVFGVLSMGSSVLGQFDVIPKADFPIGGLGLALFIGGYILCFVLPPVYSRIERLEDRVGKIESQSSQTSADVDRDP